MKKTLLLSLVLLMILTMTGCGKKTEKIEITKDNFTDYFEYVTFTHWKRDSFGDIEKDSTEIYAGWQLKKEFAERVWRDGTVIKYDKEEEILVAKLKGEYLKSYFIKYDDNEPGKYTIIGEDEEWSPLEYECRLFTLINPDTKEIHIGFFYAQHGYVNNDLIAIIPKEGQITVEKIKGTLILK